jgi:hypothetical protein
VPIRTSPEGPFREWSVEIRILTVESHRFVEIEARTSNITNQETTFQPASKSP